MKNLFLLFLILLLAPSAQAADLTGKISIEPPYPEAKIVKVKKKVQDSCADEQLSKALLVSKDGGVANTVIWLEGKFETKLHPDQSGVLDQKNCNFEPHVLLLPPGGKVKVRNSDPLAHDVRAFENAVMLFRLDMADQGMQFDESFKKPGIYTLRCGLHLWMHAFIVYPEHDYYAVTDGNGRFEMKNVPEGKYALHLWHETLGEVQVPVETSGNLKEFSYTFKKQPAL